MYNQIPRAPIILAVVAGTIALFVIALVLFSFLSPSSPSSTATPTTSPKISPGAKKFIGQPSDSFTRNTKELEQKSAAFFTQEKKVGALLSKLPHTATSLTLSYDYKRNTYVATITQSSREIGEKELADFLEANGVERAWIRELDIVYK